MQICINIVNKNYFASAISDKHELSELLLWNNCKLKYLIARVQYSTAGKSGIPNINIVVKLIKNFNNVVSFYIKWEVILTKFCKDKKAENVTVLFHTEELPKKKKNFKT